MHEAPRCVALQLLLLRDPPRLGPDSPSVLPRPRATVVGGSHPNTGRDSVLPLLADCLSHGSLGLPSLVDEEKCIGERNAADI